MPKRWELYAEDAPREWTVPCAGWVRADPEAGRVEIRASVQAISSQATGSAKAPFKNLLRSLTRNVTFIITCDIQMEVCWWSPLRERYESDGSADVDNILKPIVDSLSGPDGIMVNDCQLQRVESYWVTADRTHSLHIEARSFDQFILPKPAVVFIELSRALYFPFDDSFGSTANVMLLDSLVERFEHRARLEAMGYGYDPLHDAAAAGFSPLACFRVSSQDCQRISR